MDRDAGECNALEPTSPPTTPQSKAGAKPTPRGGAVRDGRFDLTETNVFGKHSVPVTIQSAMEIDAGKFRTTSRILGATSRLSGNYKPQERKSA